MSAVLIAYVARHVDWQAVWLLLRGADPAWAATGSLLTAVLIAGLSIRWWILLRQQRIGIPLRTVFRLTWTGQFFNAVLPGSTGGDVVKIYQICRIAPERKAAATATVFADRFAALLALLAMAGTGVLIDPLPLRLLPRWQVSGGTLAVAAAGLAIAGALGAWGLFRALRHTSLMGRITRTFTASKQNVSLNARFAGVLCLAVALHCLNFLMFYCFARALGATITYGQVLLMMPVLFFIVLLPVTINGHGLRELLLIAYFTQLGVVAAGHLRVPVEELAVGVSLLAVANDLVWSLPGGLFGFRSPPRDPQPDSVSG